VSPQVLIEMCLPVTHVRIIIKTNQPIAVNMQAALELNQLLTKL